VLNFIAEREGRDAPRSGQRSGDARKGEAGPTVRVDLVLWPSTGGCGPGAVNQDSMRDGETAPGVRVYTSRSESLGPRATTRV